jgi:hypothetical protein
VYEWPEKVHQFPDRVGAVPGIPAFPMIYAMNYSEHKYILLMIA